MQENTSLYDKIKTVLHTFGDGKERLENLKRKIRFGQMTASDYFDSIMTYGGDELQIKSTDDRAIYTTEIDVSFNGRLVYRHSHNYYIRGKPDDMVIVHIPGEWEERLEDKFKQALAKNQRN